MASSAHSQGANADIPRKIGVVLFPGFQNIDAFGPIDVINGAGWYIPNLELYFLSHDPCPVTTKVLSGKRPLNFGFEITPTHTFDNPPDLDVLLVPGGIGTWAGISDPVLTSVRSFIVRIYPKVKYLLTVCTGSTLVAQTGLLNGKRATGNKASWEWVTKQGPHVDWQKKARWVEEGNIWTSSGVTAGIDMAFAWIAHAYNFKATDADGNLVGDLAEIVANRMEYKRHTDPNWDPFADLWELEKKE